MYINISTSETGNNKGSSGALVHYLDKENRLFEQVPEAWFNGNTEGIPSYRVKSELDNNVAKLCHNDAKFFLINISPSQKEIAYIKAQYGERGAKEKLKYFATLVMNDYAKNFNRNGIASNKDLLWFGKLENFRYYSFADKEVKEGLKKKGDVKPGENMHIQVIVSRKDITNKIRLSPMNKSKGKNAEHSKKLGQFDRSAFKQSGERLFDKQFDFDRGLKETFKYANIQINGSLEQRLELHKDLRSEPRMRESQNRQQIRQQQLEKTFTNATSQNNLLDIALKASYEGNIPSAFMKKKKNKKRQGQSMGLGM